MRYFCFIEDENHIWHQLVRCQGKILHCFYNYLYSKLILLKLMCRSKVLKINKVIVFSWTYLYKSSYDVYLLCCIHWS